MNRRECGARGETLALAYLQKRGYALVAKNYRALRCEVDLILRDGETLVFAEVKARASSAYGLAREAVTPAKQRNIIKAAEVYLASHGLAEACVRFDVLEVDLVTGFVTHIPGAFTL